MGTALGHSYAVRAPARNERDFSSLLVIPITDKQTCFATQLIWILDRYGVLYMKIGVIETLSWIPPLLSSTQLGP